MHESPALAGADVSRETFERLEVFAALLAKWNPVINLVARSTLPDLWTRHFSDSAQLLSFAPKHATRWADLGTGGGFPGAIVAILAAENHGDLSITCVESDTRKATFLREVSRQTDVTFEVISERIEETKPLNADIVSARALAPLNGLLDFAVRHLKPDGTALFLKGTNADPEIQDALANWRFEFEKFPSATDPAGAILRIGEIFRV